MKERIQTLASRKKYSAVAAVILAGCVVLLAACTFTGNKTTEEYPNALTETGISETVTESASPEKKEETEPESSDQPERIPLDNYLDVTGEEYLGEYIRLHFVMREGGTGTVQFPTYMPDEEKNQLMIEAEFLDKTGTLLDVRPYGIGWGGREGEPEIQFEYWNVGGQVSEILIHAQCNGSGYDLRYQVKESEKPIEIPMNLELTGMNGERAALTEAKIYSNALLLCLEGNDEERTPFYKNNVVLLKRKGWDDPGTYSGPASAKSDGDNLQLIYRIEKENIGSIEALACGVGGEKEKYAITPVTFAVE